MKAVHADVQLVSDIREEHRSWLAYSEIDLLHDFELQAWSGWSLSIHQRRMVEHMVETANDRREMAMSLSQQGVGATTPAGRNKVSV